MINRANAERIKQQCLLNSGVRPKTTKLMILIHLKQLTQKTCGAVDTQTNMGIANRQENVHENHVHIAEYIHDVEVREDILILNKILK